MRQRADLMERPEVTPVSLPLQTVAVRSLLVPLEVEEEVALTQLLEEAEEAEEDRLLLVTHQQPQPEVREDLVHWLQRLVLTVLRMVEEEVPPLRLTVLTVVTRITVELEEEALP